MEYSKKGERDVDQTECVAVCCSVMQRAKLHCVVLGCNVLQLQLRKERCTIRDSIRQHVYRKTKKYARSCINK